MLTVSAPQVGQSIRLPDGRRLGYAEFGDPAGTPVVFFHGWGDSRLTRHPDDARTAALGVRLITVDRPGTGISDFQPGRTLLDWPADVAALADTLGLRRFAVFGHSGAGPHTLACAYKIADRLTAVGVVCGFAPFDRPDATTGMRKDMQQFIPLLRRMPWLTTLFLSSLPRQYRRDPDKAFEKQFGHDLPASDLQMLARPEIRANVLAGAVESLRPGARGMAHEARLLFAQPWGFQPAAIQAEVWLWYGGSDVIVPPQQGEYLARAIPHSHLTIYPGEGHMVHITHWTEILQTLVAAG